MVDDSERLQVGGLVEVPDAECRQGFVGDEHRRRGSAFVAGADELLVVAQVRPVEVERVVEEGVGLAQLGPVLDQLEAEPFDRVPPDPEPSG